MYYQAFEKGRIRELATMFPDLAPALEAILERVVDLLPTTRNHYHHPSMGGSWSIKTVLPAIAPDLDYSQLEHVQDGGGASEAYLEILDPATTEERRAALLEALRALLCARYSSDGPPRTFIRNSDTNPVKNTSSVVAGIAARHQPCSTPVHGGLLPLFLSACYFAKQTRSRAIPSNAQV